MYTAVTYKVTDQTSRPTYYRTLKINQSDRPNAVVGPLAAGPSGVLRPLLMEWRTHCLLIRLGLSLDHPRVGNTFVNLCTRTRVIDNGHSALWRGAAGAINVIVIRREGRGGGGGGEAKRSKNVIFVLTKLIYCPR